MIEIIHKGDFKNTEKFLKKMSQYEIDKILRRYAKEGVTALSAATPIDSGETASSWTYEIKAGFENATIYWSNTNTNNGVNIAIILQYGHGTGTGGYVVGRDYINPAMRPVFDKIADSAWREVVKA